MTAIQRYVAVLFLALAACQPVKDAQYPFDASSMVASQGIAPADGNSQAAVQLTLRDTTGAIVPRRGIAFSASESDAVLTQPSETDAYGQATAYLTKKTPGDVTVRVRAQDANAWTELSACGHRRCRGLRRAGAWSGPMPLCTCWAPYGARPPRRCGCRWASMCRSPPGGRPPTRAMGCTTRGALWPRRAAGGASITRRG